MPVTRSARARSARPTKKPTAGSGGRVKRGLEGKGPTPKAKDRPNHQAHKAAKKKAAKSAAARPKRRNTGDAEWIAGRNSVVEALREGVPVNGVYVAEGAERDGRLREAFRLASEHGISLLEVTKGELDRMTAGAVHQGLAARIPAYEYAHPDDLLAARTSWASRRWSWRSTRSPTRATSAPRSAARRRSARTASSSPSGARPA